MLTEKQFEGHLSRRHFEPPSIGFAERIIAGAKEKEAYSLYKTGYYLNKFILSLLPERRPVFALAFILIIGILIGTSLPVQMGGEEYATTGDEEIL